MLRKFLEIKGKRGNTGAVYGTIGTIVALFVLGAFVFGFAIAGGELKNATSDTNAQNVVDDVQSGLQSFSNLLNPIFVIAGIVLLLVVLIGGLGGVAYMFMSRRQ